MYVRGQGLDNFKRPTVVIVSRKPEDFLCWLCIAQRSMDLNSCLEAKWRSAEFFRMAHPSARLITSRLRCGACVHVYRFMAACERLTYGGFWHFMERRHGRGWIVPKTYHYYCVIGSGHIYSAYTFFGVYARLRGKCTHI